MRVFCRPRHLPAPSAAGPLPNLNPTWNMAPTMDAPIVLFDADSGTRQLEVAKWGLVPFFTKYIVLQN
jgi:putative SOS response-associated peptidase YedK